MARLDLWVWLLALRWSLALPVLQKWSCMPLPGKCHGHREQLALTASPRMARRLAAPFLVDWDGDGSHDLLVGENDGTVRYYKEVNGKYFIQSGAGNPFRVITAAPRRNGSYSAATPVAVDFDGDGELELVLSVEGRIRYFKRRGGELWEVADSPFSSIRCSWLICRFDVADWDGDGDMDVVVSEGRGLAYFENSNGAMIPRTGGSNPFHDVVAKYVDNHRGWDGFYSSPCMADWDGDGDLDLLVGQADGSVLYFERVESDKPVQQEGPSNPFAAVKGHAYPAVHAADVNGDGKLQLMVGDLDGKVNIYSRKQDLRLRRRHGTSNPFHSAGLLTSAVPAVPLVDEYNQMYLMFQQANVGRVQIFQRLANGTLRNITNGTPAAASLATWRPAGQAIDVDFNKDGQMDRLNIYHDGRIEYQERVNGVLEWKTGPESPFFGLDLDNGLADAKVAGFLPIDWNGDGKMDLLIGPWGLGHLKYFEAGWCNRNPGCNSKGICNEATGDCACMTGYNLGDCSGCARGYFTSGRPSGELTQYSCHKCPGILKHDAPCKSRGVCNDDYNAMAAAPGRSKGVVRGNGTCSCSPFFSGEDCSMGDCPPGFEYDGKQIIALCVSCRPGYSKEGANNIERCELCPEGHYASENSTAECSKCSGSFFLYDVNKERTECTTGLLENVPTFLAVLLCSILIFLLPLLHGLPVVVLDIRRTLGADGRVRITTSGRHFILHMDKAPRVRFWGTGVPQLDKQRYGFRARCHTSREIELLHRDGDDFVTDQMASSTGCMQVLPRHAFAFSGVSKIPFVMWLLFPVVLYVTLMVVFWPRYTKPLAAVGLHLFLGAVIAGIWHWQRWRSLSNTQLVRDVRAFEGLIRRRYPRPLSCQKGASRAISAQQLHDFLDFFRNYVGTRTTYYVVHNIILPLTEPYKLSYAEVAGPSTSPSRWFVSHFWGTPFAHLVSTVERHSFEFMETHPYWICTFSNNQWAVEEELGSTYHESSFYQAMRSEGTLGTVMVFDEEAMPLTRSWCLFELLQTCLLKGISRNFKGLLLCSPLGIMNTGKGSLDLAMNVSKKLAVLDLEAAQASMQSDKDMIDNLVRQEGGFEQVNNFLADAVNEVMTQLKEQFTKNIKSLEIDLAKKKGRSKTAPVGALECLDSTDDEVKDGTPVKVRSAPQPWQAQARPMPALPQQLMAPVQVRRVQVIHNSFTPQVAHVFPPGGVPLRSQCGLSNSAL